MVKHTQAIRQLLPTNCFSVFDHFVGLAFKELKKTKTLLKLNENTYQQKNFKEFRSFLHMRLLPLHMKSKECFIDVMKISEKLELVIDFSKSNLQYFLILKKLLP